MSVTVREEGRDRAHDPLAPRTRGKPSKHRNIFISLEERFESRVLPLFLRRTREVDALLPELYLHGLAEGDFELAMSGLLGEGAPLSKSSIRRLRKGWTEDSRPRPPSCPSDLGS